MNDVENKKQTSESPVRPEKKKIYCRPRSYTRFYTKIKRSNKTVAKIIPKTFHAQA